MSAQFELQLDPRIGAWLAEGSDAAPDALLGRVLGAVAALPQRKRRGWAPIDVRPASRSWLSLGRLSMIGLVVAVLIVAGGAGAFRFIVAPITATPTPSPSVSPSPSPSPSIPSPSGGPSGSPIATGSPGAGPSPMPGPTGSPQASGQSSPSPSAAATPLPPGRLRLGSTGLTMAVPPTGANGDWRVLLRPCDGTLTPVPSKLMVPLGVACNAPDGALSAVLRQGSKVRGTFVGTTFGGGTVFRTLSEAAGSWLATGSPGQANTGSRSQQIALGNAPAYLISYELGSPAIAHRDYVVVAPEGYAALQFAMAPEDAASYSGDVQALVDTVQGYVTEPGGPAVPEGGRVFIGGSDITVDLGPPDGAWRVGDSTDHAGCGIASAIAQGQFPGLRANVSIGCARVSGELRALHWVGADPMGALRAYRAGDNGPTAARDFADALFASIPTDSGAPAPKRRSVALSIGVTAEWIGYSTAITGVPGAWDGVNAWFVPTTQGVIALEFHGMVGDGSKPAGRQIVETLRVDVTP